jgi:hypothetical protein
MNVRILMAIAGNAEPQYDQPEFSYQPGQIVAVDPNLGAAWIASGVAESVVPFALDSGTASSASPVVIDLGNA